ncbi:MAG: 50S ribosomal protein L4 [Zestosphaera sp.]
MTDRIVVFEAVERKVPVLSAGGEVVGELTLPPIFSLPVRKDLIRRAFLAAFTARLQPKGRDPLAGKRRVGESWGIGHSSARVPRLDNGRAVIAPMTRGGRPAHPPKVEKILREDINRKEKLRALASAIAATSVPQLVRQRGHVFGREVLPVIVEDSALKVSKTGEARKVLASIGVIADVMRAGERTRIRAGKGKMRGRRYVTPRSVLIVTHEDDVSTYRAFRNLPGVDVVSVKMLSVLHLAPGGSPGRLTVYTKSAVDELKKRFEVITV